MNRWIISLLVACCLNSSQDAFCSVVNKKSSPQFISKKRPQEKQAPKKTRERKESSHSSKEFASYFLLSGQYGQEYLNEQNVVEFVPASTTATSGIILSAPGSFTFVKGGIFHIQYGANLISYEGPQTVNSPYWFNLVLTDENNNSVAQPASRVDGSSLIPQAITNSTILSIAAGETLTLQLNVRKDQAINSVKLGDPIYGASAYNAAAYLTIVKIADLSNP